MNGPRGVFEQSIAAAMAASLEGWDFSWLEGRSTSTELPWDYEALAAELVTGARRVLDVDTGGGEVLSRLDPPAGSVALEPYAPNVAVAAARLRPRGVEVRERSGSRWPVPASSFDLVLNRHGFFDPIETFRALTPGGRLLSQQVGRDNDVELNAALGLPAGADDSAPSTAAELEAGLSAAGFAEHRVVEAFSVTRYLEIGAVVFQLRAVPWQAPGFDVVRHREQLREIDRRIQGADGFEVRSQRFLIRARRPG